MRTLGNILTLGLLGGMLACSGVRAGTVKLTLDVGHPWLLAGKKQTTYVKLGLSGLPPKADRRRAPVNVAIVLDRSGSMSGLKLRRAQEAAIMAIDRLAPRDIVSVVAYNHNVRVLVPATKGSDKQAIFSAINRLSADGRTALFAGVSKGAREVRKFLAGNRVNRVILLSDGLANVGPSSPDALAELGASLIKEGISVTTIGLGLGYNEDLMVKLARAADGNHAFVESPGQLAQIFNYEFGDLLSVVASDLEVVITCAPGVRPVRVLGRRADIIGSRVSTRLNQIYGRQEKYVLLEVEVQGREAGSSRPLVTARVDYFDVAGERREHLVASSKVTYTGSRELVQRRTNSPVMVEVVTQIANENNKRALALRDQGKTDEARRMLLHNEHYLNDSASRYRSRRLREIGRINRSDADNLSPGRWNRRRKQMRKKQYEFDAQQAW